MSENEVEETYEEAVEDLLVNLSSSEKVAWDKARMCLKRENSMWKALLHYTKRIKEADTIEEAHFFNDQLINALCFMKEPELD